MYSDVIILLSMFEATHIVKHGKAKRFSDAKYTAKKYRSPV